MLVSTPAPPFSFFPKAKALGPSHSSVSPVVVTVVTSHRAVTEKLKEPLLQSVAPSDDSRPPTPFKRKRTDKDALQRVKRSRSSSVDATPPPPSRAGSRQRGVDSASTSSASSSRASTRTRTSPPTSDALYRSSRSRSTSVLPAADEPIPRDCCIAEHATPEEGFLSSEVVVQELMKSYKGYFKNPKNPADLSFQPHPTDYPIAELEYPNSGACERYILLVPKDKDHYDPIKDLLLSLYDMLKNYLTDEQRHVFGSFPDDLVHPLDSHAKDHLQILRRAYKLMDGPLFLSTLSDINAVIRTLKYPPLPSDLFAPALPNVFKAAVRDWTPTGLPQNVSLRLIDETYQRTVGPHTHELARYEAFSSQVYGELMPSLVANIITQTRLRPGMLMLDLGSGVGNVVLQAALQSGCDTFGVELMKAPAALAREQRRQMMIRARMWGVNMGNVELEEGDMLESVRVTELIKKADVVLVNNKVFLESLNEAIRPKFLDLKEGAIVVSLKPFVSSVNARLTERNIDDISAIFDVSEHQYESMDVSWGSGSGQYYMHRVDREGYAEIRAAFERGQRFLSARSTRSRR